MNKIIAGVAVLVLTFTVSAQSVMAACDWYNERGPSSDITPGDESCVTDADGSGSTGTAVYSCDTYSDAFGSFYGCYRHDFICSSSCGSAGVPGGGGGGYVGPTCSGGQVLTGYNPQGYLNSASCQFLGTCDTFFPSSLYQTGCDGVASKGVCTVSYLCCNPGEVITCSSSASDTYEIESTSCPAGEMKVSARATRTFVLGELVTHQYVTCRRSCACTPSCSAVAPTAPTLLTPSNNSTQASANVSLIWNATSSFGTKCPAPNSNEYKLYIESCSSIGVPVSPTTLYATTTATSNGFVGTVGTSYCWRVAASNGSSETTSTTRRFTIQSNVVSGVVYSDYAS